LAAVAEGDRQRVREMLAAGINPDRPSAIPWGERALMVAVDRGDVEMVRELLEGGAHPDLRGKGFTPLGMAALRGHGRITRMLLKAGADPDLKGTDGNTPLFLAARLDRVEVVRALLAGGADMRVPSRGFAEEMPMDTFLVTHKPHFAKFDLNLNDYNGLTPLGVAALENNVASMRLLLEAGADPNFRDRGKLTPIFYAIFRQHRAATDLLLAHGADAGGLRTDF
jgi:ankyrin repeat protein